MQAGSCLCGRVTFEAHGEPVSVAVCHCASCRKHTGAPMAAYADFLREQVRFLGEAPQTFESSPGVFRGFCPACGGALTYQAGNLPHMIHIHLGAFDDPAAFTPAAEESVGARLPWVAPIASTAKSTP